MMKASKPWNVEPLRALVGDDQTVIRRLLTDYLESLETAARACPAAVAAGDATAVAELAHKLKSSSRWVGAADLGSFCEAIELAARAGDMETVAARLPEFERESALIKSAVSDYLG